jgi:hypothetical protein
VALADWLQRFLFSPWYINRTMLLTDGRQTLAGRLKPVAHASEI